MSGAVTPDTRMAVASPVDLWIEIVDRNGVIANNSTTSSPAQKVLAIMQRLAPSVWAQYRLAYGVYELVYNSDGDSRSKLLGLQWVDERLTPNLSLGELFQDTRVQHARRYFLLMSRLGEGSKNLQRHDYPANSPCFIHCLQRYAALYAWPRVPAPPPAPSRKRPASPPTSDSAAQCTLHADLAALKALLL
jgi:hypothetical protein